MTELAQKSPYIGKCNSFSENCDFSDITFSAWLSFLSKHKRMRLSHFTMHSCALTFSCYSIMHPIYLCMETWDGLTFRFLTTDVFYPETWSCCGEIYVIFGFLVSVFREPSVQNHSLQVCVRAIRAFLQPPRKLLDTGRRDYCPDHRLRQAASLEDAQPKPVSEYLCQHGTFVCMSVFFLS